MKSKILIIGHARHGKDFAAEILNKHFGYTFQSSSRAAVEIFLFKTMNEKYGCNYKTIDECFNDRMNWRKEWYNEIFAYNAEDKSRLARKITEESDIYVGMRDFTEVNECRKTNLFDLILWIDASERLPLESTDSFSITENIADVSVKNNGNQIEFETKLVRLFKNFRI